MKRVLLLVLEGAEVLETAAFLDVLGWASTYGSEPVEVVTAGFNREVRCSFGLTVLTDVRVRDVAVGEFDALAVPGGFEEHGFYREAYSGTVGALIQAFDGSRKTIASVCVGALPVAHSGVLRGRCATTYALSGGRRRQLAAFDVKVLDQAVVTDGNVITSTSPATAIDVALLLLERLTGGENAREIRALMGFARGSGAGEATRPG